MNTCIGLTGVAGAGKDLFFSLLSKKIKCTKFSLADALKKEVSPFAREFYGIDPLDCSRKDKEIIRPLLVVHGAIKRDRTKGRYWVNKLNKEIKNNMSSSIVVITDIRYDDYPEDEVFWLKEELGGYLVHISQYKLTPKPNRFHREYKKPANIEEERSDPKVKLKADYLVDWEKANENLGQKLELHINDFLKWLNEKEDGLSAYEKTEE
jgi:hypothetical protein